MKLNGNTEIEETLESLKAGMIGYIEIGKPAYSEKDVEKCITLIETFLIDMAPSENKESGMKLVKEIVLNLNELNEECRHELIETDQREQIAEIIILSGHLKGYNDRDEDITEELREW